MAATIAGAARAPACEAESVGPPNLQIVASGVAKPEVSGTNDLEILTLTD
jgi:hypothetical protein